MRTPQLKAGFRRSGCVLAGMAAAACFMVLMLVCIDRDVLADEDPGVVLFFGLAVVGSGIAFVSVYGLVALVGALVLAARRTLRRIRARREDTTG